MTDLSLDTALAVLAAARAKAKELGRTPLAYAIVDAGGHVLVQAREDGQGFGRGAIAVAKAAGSVAMGMSGAKLAKAAAGYENWFTGISGALSGQIVPTPGGVLIRAQAGHVIGAVGIAGAPSADDETIAVYAIQSAGLIADS
jgi:uncharacterized protein GlcG (DUF336 family)